VTAPHVVVFRPGALGDTIVASDALAAIRGRFPKSTIELVGNASAASLLRASGLVDVATSFDSLDVAALFGRTPGVASRWRDLELAVLWLNDAEAIADAFRAAGAARVVVARPHPAHAVHVADHLVESVRSVGISPDTGGPALLTPRWPRMPRLLPEGTALLHPGSGSPSKNWPAERFAALATQLLGRGCPVRLLLGPADTDAVHEVQALLRRPDVAVAEPSDVLALADLLASAELYVGSDSGVSHLSARLGVPTVAVFGPTDSRVWAPRGAQASVIEDAGAWPSVPQVCDAALALAGEPG
jgi:heptosyltransferase III